MTEASISDAKNGNYLLSWGKSLVARVIFAVDAVLRAVALVFDALLIGWFGVEAFYTWGHQGKENLNCHLEDSSEQLHRLFFNLFGIFTPYFATQWHEVSLVEKFSNIMTLLCPTRLNFFHLSWKIDVKS